MAYTGTITTESLYYPVTLALALTLVRYLERPGSRGSRGCAAALAVAFATRSQSLAFVPAIATAPLVLAALRRRLDVVRPFLPLYVIGTVGALGLVVVQALRGESLTDLLGAYSVVGEGGYDVGSVLRFWLWHVEELDLYVGHPARSPRSSSFSHAVARCPTACRSTLPPPRRSSSGRPSRSAAFASRFASDRVQDRYLFFLAPLLVVCLLAWVEHPVARPRIQTAVAAGIALALPLLFPFERFIGEPAKSDTLGLVPLWSVNEHLVAGRYWVTVGVVGALLAAVLLAARERYAIAAPLVVLALFVAGLAAGLVGAERVPRGEPRSAVPGDPEGAAGLDRSRRAGGRRGGRALDRSRGSLHRQPGRVLQPARRARLLHLPADAGRDQRDAVVAGWSAFPGP